MTTNSVNRLKRTYCSPLIERIELDNNISLQLQSDNTPDGDPDQFSGVPEYFNNDPFKANVG